MVRVFFNKQDDCMSWTHASSICLTVTGESQFGKVCRDFFSVVGLEVEQGESGNPRTLGEVSAKG